MSNQISKFKKENENCVVAPHLLRSHRMRLKWGLHLRIVGLE